jgi:hypothetical protein
VRVCKTCGAYEADHHEPDWLEIPEGCKCDWRDWYCVKSTIPPICDEYQEDSDSGMCAKCEHNEECHA